MFTSQNNTRNHNYFMCLALEQAKSVLGNTKENPAVGCIVVKNNNVISAASTGLNGRPHAESNAMNLPTSKSKNSKIYVTLEPCVHYGKTAPCVNLIIKKKVKHVFFSIKDPDKRTFNKSSKLFKKKGVFCYIGVLSNEISSFYRSYVISKKKVLPFVTCKLAISKDFFTVNKKRKWITNEFSRGRVHLLRMEHDCIITSSRTIIDDNPRLNCRIKGLSQNSPPIIILDKNLRINVKSRIFVDNRNVQKIVFYNKLNKKRAKQLVKLKAKLFKIPLDRYENLNLKKVLIKAKELGFSRIFLESGLNLIINFLKSDLINDFKLFKSNKNIKADGKKNFKKDFLLFLNKRKSSLEKVNLLGDKLISYKLK